MSNTDLSQSCISRMLPIVLLQSTKSTVNHIAIKVKHVNMQLFHIFTIKCTFILSLVLHYFSVTLNFKLSGHTISDNKSVSLCCIRHGNECLFCLLQELHTASTRMYAHRTSTHGCYDFT